MNREAAALGTPVWSMFEGRLGGVDEQLVREGRLQLLAADADVSGIEVVRRAETGRPATTRDPGELLALALPWAGLSGADAVREALEHIEAAVEAACPAPRAARPRARDDHAAGGARRRAPRARRGAPPARGRRRRPRRPRRSSAPPPCSPRRAARTTPATGSRRRRADDAGTRLPAHRRSAAHRSSTPRGTGRSSRRTPPPPHLVGRTTPTVADAVAAYVAAYRGVLQAGETLDAEAVAAPSRRPRPPRRGCSRRSGLDTYPYGYVTFLPWPEQRPRPTRSTRWLSPAAGRSSICWPAGSARSATWSRELGLGQPQVSKHLRVLREVGVVEVRDQGRQRLYRLNGHALKPIHDWVKSYERLWSERFELLDDVLEDLKKEQGRWQRQLATRRRSPSRPTTRSSSSASSRRRRTSCGARSPSPSSCERWWHANRGEVHRRARSTCASAASGATPAARGRRGVRLLRRVPRDRAEREDRPDRDLRAVPRQRGDEHHDAHRVAAA